jgi:hypothetical protein
VWRSPIRVGGGGCFSALFIFSAAYHSENQSSVSPQNLLMSYVGLSPRSALIDLLSHHSKISKQSFRASSSSYFLITVHHQPSLLLMTSTYMYDIFA